MDLRAWICTEHAALADRFEQSVVAHVPLERWTDPAGGGGSSIAFLTFHAAYHEDLAVNAVLRRRSPVLHGWRERLGLEDGAAHVGLAEAEPVELTAALDREELVAYANAVHERTQAWLGTVDATALDAVPDAAAGLSAAGVEQPAVPWLFGMWSGRPASWFVQWEAIGHRVNHLGEMVSVRNRLGLSPF